MAAPHHAVRAESESDRRVLCSGAQQRLRGIDTTGNVLKSFRAIETRSLAMTAPPQLRCHVCGHVAEPAGEKYSSFSKRSFALAHCPSCRYSFVVDPRTDFAAIYDADY